MKAIACFVVSDFPLAYSTLNLTVIVSLTTYAVLMVVSVIRGMVRLPMVVCQPGVTLEKADKGG